jgi:hypothetical protein
MTTLTTKTTKTFDDLVKDHENENKEWNYTKELDSLLKSNTHGDGFYVIKHLLPGTELLIIENYSPFLTSGTRWHWYIFSYKDYLLEYYENEIYEKEISSGVFNCVKVYHKSEYKVLLNKIKTANNVSDFFALQSDIVDNLDNYSLMMAYYSDKYFRKRENEEIEKQEREKAKKLKELKNLQKDLKDLGVLEESDDLQKDLKDLEDLQEKDIQSYKTRTEYTTYYKQQQTKLNIDNKKIDNMIKKFADSDTWNDDELWKKIVNRMKKTSKDPTQQPDTEETPVVKETKRKKNIEDYISDCECDSDEEMLIMF